MTDISNVKGTLSAAVRQPTEYSESENHRASKRLPGFTVAKYTPVRKVCSKEYYNE